LESDDHPARQPTASMLSAPVPRVVTCAHCGEEVVEVNLVGDEEERVLRAHLLAVHRMIVRPETLSVLLRHFVVTEEPPPAA